MHWDWINTSTNVFKTFNRKIITHFKNNKQFYFIGSRYSSPVPEAYMDPSTDYHSNQVQFATEIKPNLECSGMAPYSSAMRYREDIYTKSENSPVGN